MSNKKELYHAAQHGNVDEVKRILSLDGVDINQGYEFGDCTPLCIASRYGHVGVVIMLLQRGADVNNVNRLGETSLFIASRYGHVPVVELLLQHGANVNQGTNYGGGQNPIFAAVETGNKEIVKILLANGAEINGHDFLHEYDSETEKKRKKLNKDAVAEILNRWPHSMWLTMLEDLFVTHLVDAESKKDFFAFYGDPSHKGGKRRKSNKKIKKTIKKRGKTNKRRR